MLLLFTPAASILFINHTPPHPQHLPTTNPHQPKIQLVDVVAGFVVVGVVAGEVEGGGDAFFDEVVVVGAGVVAVLVFPVVEAVVELEVRVLLADGSVELVEPGVELFVPDHVHVAALAGAVVPGVAAADHVDVEVGQGLFERDQRGLHVELRAEQPLLLPAHGQEEDAVL